MTTRHLETACHGRLCFLAKWFAALWLTTEIAAAGGVVAAPGFAMSFSPNSIGAGATSTLTFTITNDGRDDATGAAFTDTLPAGVTIATPAEASTDCVGAMLSAPAGGSTITLSGGTVPAQTSCTVRVKVKGNTQGAQMNTSGALTSSFGNSGTASATLTVGAGGADFLDELRATCDRGRQA